MKIGVDARPLTVPTFGIGRYTQEVLKRLTSNSEHQWFFYADRPLNSVWPDCVQVRDFSNHNPVMSLARTQLSFAHWAALDKLDVFWSPRHHLPLLLDIPQVVTIHDLVWRKFPETMQRANLFVERLLMPPSVHQAQSIICVSESTRKDLVQELDIPPGKACVIHLAANSPELANKNSISNDSYFLFLGTNDPRKNLPRLLSAFQLYRQAGGQQELWIVGGAGWGQELHAQEGVRLLGYVDDEHLDALIQNATAMVLPSLYEGFGLPQLEAIQRGVPVISSNVSAIPEVVGDAGILIDPLNELEIKEALISMSDPAQRTHYAALCPVQAQKFSWHKTAIETLRVIEAAML